jgi:hypothetical protein
MPRKPDLSARRAPSEWRQLAESRVRRLKARSYEQATIAESALQLGQIAAAILRDVGDGRRLAELAGTVDEMRDT